MFSKVFSKNNIFTVTALVLVWVILREDISLASAIMGLVIGIGCVLFFNKFLSFDKMVNVSFKWLLLYIFYLIGQIYLAGFQVIRLIFVGAKVDVMHISTEITNKYLRVIIANSITLIPGSVVLDMSENEITLLWLRGLDTPDPEDIPDADDIIKGNLEKRLLKAQR